MFNKTGKNYYFHNKFNYFFSKLKIEFNVFSGLNIKFKKIRFYNYHNSRKSIFVHLWRPS